MQDGQSDYYNHYWEKGVAGWSARNRKTSAYEYRFLERFVRPGMRVLDVGCGAGRLAEWFQQHGLDYSGVDISQNAVDELRQRGFRVQQANIMESLPFEEGTFDVVVVFEVLEHLFSPQSCLAEMGRVLKDGGVLLGSVPNIAFLPNRLMLMAGIFNPGGAPSTALKTPWCDPHIRFFCRRSLSLFLRNCERLDAFRIEGRPFSLLDFPVLYKQKGMIRSLLNLLGLPFGFLGRLYPALFSSHLFFSATSQSVRQGPR